MYISNVVHVLVFFMTIYKIVSSPEMYRFYDVSKLGHLGEVPNSLKKKTSKYLKPLNGLSAEYACAHFNSQYYRQMDVHIYIDVIQLQHGYAFTHRFVRHFKVHISHFLKPR